jgi:hypothetical protein
LIWFGKSWGAPICAPEDHAPTPTGEPCLYCGYPIEPEDNGVMMPLVNAPEHVTIEAAHRLCFLDHILPHGPHCTRCRGLGRTEHLVSCSHAISGDECDCRLGQRMQLLLEPTVTLAEAYQIAEEMGLPHEQLEDIARRSLEYVADMKRRRAAHKLVNDWPHRKAP